MAPVRTQTVTSLREYTDLVEQLNAATVPLWYRGCGNSAYPLVPSLYRHPSVGKVPDLIELEADLLARFKQRSIPFQTRQLADDWDYLFVMQHCGVPTRLLDWTENPYIGLYFAIVSAERHRDAAGAFLTDAVVWVLNPTSWNRKALSHFSFTGGILSVHDTQLRGYEPKSDFDLMNNEPVGIYGMHNSARIVAQRGVFTIFGKTADPMEAVYDTLAFPTDALVQLVLPAARLSNLQASIFAIGYTDSVVYPDLDGLARELRRHFGFYS